METAQSAGLAVLGFLACFSGYSMFKSILPLWGFLMIGWLAMTIVPMFVEVPASQQLMLKLGAFFGGGIIGAIISKWLYYVLVFLAGAALGALAGIVAGAILEIGGFATFGQVREFTSMTMTFPPQVTTAVQFLLMVVFGLVLGGLAIGFQKFMITASSAFVGAAGLVGGMAQLFGNSLSIEGLNLLLVMAWMFIGFIGMFVQYRMSDEV